VTAKIARWMVHAARMTQRGGKGARRFGPVVVGVVMVCLLLVARSEDVIQRHVERVGDPERHLQGR
jgi:hypothetical protein